MRKKLTRHGVLILLTAITIGGCGMQQADIITPTRPLPTLTATLIPTVQPTPTPTRTIAELDAEQLQVVEIKIIPMDLCFFLESGSAPALDWSPDGKKIANDCGNIWIANADGSGLHKLLKEPGTVLGVGWSPDGKRLAYATDKGIEPYPDPMVTPYEIWVVDADGQNQRRLTYEVSEENPHGIRFLDWSPDGKRMLVYFVGVEGGVGIMDINTGTVRMIAPGNSRYAPDGLIAHYATWSPDGEKILLASQASFVQGNTDEIWTMRPDGSEHTILYSSGEGMFNVAPTWSPDGSKIAWNKGGAVWVMNADGSGVTRLITAEELGRTGLSNVIWVPPEGRQISITSGENIYLLTLGEK